MGGLHVVVHFEAEVVAAEEAFLVIFADFDVVAEVFEVGEDGGDLGGLFDDFAAEVVVVFLLVDERDGLVLLVNLRVQLAILHLSSQTNLDHVCDEGLDNVLLLLQLVGQEAMHHASKSLREREGHVCLCQLQYAGLQQTLRQQLHEVLCQSSVSLTKFLSLMKSDFSRSMTWASCLASF